MGDGTVNGVYTQGQVETDVNALFDKVEQTSLKYAMKTAIQSARAAELASAKGYISALANSIH